MDSTVNPTKGSPFVYSTVWFITPKRRNKAKQSNPRIKPNNLNQGPRG